MSTQVKLVLNICDDFHLDGRIKNERVYLFESSINLVGQFSLKRCLVQESGSDTRVAR
jgi:hypothetical protein